MPESETPLVPVTPVQPPPSPPPTPSTKPPTPVRDDSTKALVIVLVVLVACLLVLGGVFFLTKKQLKKAATVPSTTSGTPTGNDHATPPTSTTKAAAPVFLGASQFGSSQDDTAEAMAIDATGMYIAGETEGSLDGTNAGDESTATPGGTAEGVGAGHTFGLPDARDGFVEKYSLDGKTKIWGHQFGTSFRDTAQGITENSSGIYVSGETEGSLDGTLQGELDVFLHKYAPDGTLVWTKQFGTSNRDENTWIVSDETHVCLGGGTLGSFEGYQKQGNEDIFARCFDNNGNELWTLQFGTTGFQETLGATIDASGIYVVGATADAIGTDPEVGGTDMWYGHISMDGKLLGTHQFGSKVVDFGHGIATDANNVYVSGRTEGKIQGQPSAGLTDAAIFAYSKTASSGPLWDNQYGTPDGDASNDLTVDSETGGVFMIGVINGKTVKHGEETNAEDGYIREYAPTGSLLWSGSVATDGYDEPRSVQAYNGVLYVIGRTGGAMSGTNHGAWDGFISRYTITP